MKSTCLVQCKSLGSKVVIRVTLHHSSLLKSHTIFLFLTILALMDYRLDLRERKMEEVQEISLEEWRNGNK